MSDATEKPVRKSKRQRFLDVAQPRTRKVLRDIRLLGKCSNTASYAYTGADVEKIFGVIQTELDRARIGFERDKDGVKFTLGDDEEGGEEAARTE
ncbi:MAG TPA: hypothetical protein VFV19_18750 [Candidatus Polarisedimenticolaceae bacterium]|nr:hypothetical protein [Candidatus Polarisedimenticolaceae bacterium]